MRAQRPGALPERRQAFICTTIGPGQMTDQHEILTLLGEVQMLEANASLRRNPEAGRP
jgi:hypothetical protein